MRITNFIHLSQTSDTTALTTAFGTSRRHNLADKAPMQSAKWWVGILDSLNLHVDAIAGGCTKLTVRVTADPEGNESILPDTEAKIAVGIGTVTTGSVAFSAGVALSNKNALQSDCLVYVWAKTNAGTCNLKDSTIAWRE